MDSKDVFATVAVGGSAYAGYKNEGGWMSLYLLIAAVVSWFSWSGPLALVLMLIVPSIVWPILLMLEGRQTFGILLGSISFAANMVLIPFTWSLM